MLPEQATDPHAPPESSLELVVDAVIQPATALDDFDAAQTLAGYVQAALASELSPAKALQYGDYLHTISARIESGKAKLQIEGRRLETLAALLNNGGLEFVAAGRTAAHRALLERVAAFDPYELFPHYAEVVKDVRAALEGPPSGLKL